MVENGGPVAIVGVFSGGLLGLARTTPRWLNLSLGATATRRTTDQPVGD
jgi:hypothetical protein